MLKSYSLFILLLLCSTLSFAQSASIKGYVREQGSKEVMSNNAVYLEGTNYRAQTDVNGYYAITQVPPGEYTLVSFAAGFDTTRITVSLTAGQVKTQQVILRIANLQLNEVTVSIHHIEQTTRIGTGLTTITPADMKRLPSAGGEPDIAQFLQVTPGVTFTGDQGGQLYIRGGAPSQTGILLDGVTIYNPFHTIGLYSVFETDAIRSADIYTAGFNAQYGNRTSAILDIHTKDGNRNRLSGKVSASPVMGRIMLEGPLYKAKEEDGGGLTFLLSAKHSYLDQTSKGVYSGLGGAFENGLPYSFTDLYGKLTFSGSNGSKLNVFGFNFDDKAKFLKPNSDYALADFRWKATGAGANFIVSPGGSSSLISGKFAYSKYGIDYSAVSDSFPRSSGINNFEANIEVTNFLPGYSQLKYGIEVSGIHTDLNYKSNAGVNTTLDRQNTLAAVYIMFRKNIQEKLILEPSIRFQYYATINTVSPEPRLGLKYNATRNLRFKFATGLYSQNIISTKSDRDIVNFFTGFLVSPDQSINNTKGEEVKSNLQRAYHILGGIELDVKDVELNLEPWFKNFTQNIELNRYKQFAADPDFLVETGKAYGVDLSAKYNKRRVYLWGVLSYQHIERYDGQQTYAPPFDRRWNLNLLGSYTLGKRKDIEISLRYNFGSAFPFTQTQGFYENLGLANTGVNTNYTQQNGQLGLLYSSDINGGRLSNYHRIDLSAKKKFHLTKFSNIETSLNITNVLSRNNIFYVDRIENQRVYQLPFFPSINVTWNF